MPFDMGILTLRTFFPVGEVFPCLVFQAFQILLWRTVGRKELLAVGGGGQSGVLLSEDTVLARSVVCVAEAGRRVPSKGDICSGQAGRRMGC